MRKYDRIALNLRMEVFLSISFKISDACVSCGTCEGECPVNAISQGDSQYQIDADLCISCGSCAAVCPTEAISEE